MQIFTLVQQAPWNIQQSEHKLMINILRTEMAAALFFANLAELDVPYSLEHTSGYKFLFKKSHRENCDPQQHFLHKGILPFKQHFQHLLCVTLSAYDNTTAWIW